MIKSFQIFVLCLFAIGPLTQHPKGSFANDASNTRLETSDLSAAANARPDLTPNPSTQPAIASSQPSTKSDPRVIIISIDGLRPDLALRAKMPNLRSAMESGSFSFWARTTPLAITLPSHTSMLTGVIPRKHEIEWNKDLKLVEPVYPSFPTLFEVAHARGYSTAMVAGKSKFNTLAKPGTLDWNWIAPTSTAGDAEVVKNAIAIMQKNKPQVLFVHLPGTDNAGHAIGWGSANQISAIENADSAIGELFTVLDELQLRKQTTVFITADHGGAGRTHVPDDARSRHIPWIAVGPGIRKNVDLTTIADLTINTEDTFATACFVLKIPVKKEIDGKPIKEIFDGELIH